VALWAFGLWPLVFGLWAFEPLVFGLGFWFLVFVFSAGAKFPLYQTCLLIGSKNQKPKAQDKGPS
jgi:hypothetical protein